jgi:hypothetical protein
MSSPVDAYAALVRSNQPHHHVERRRLPCPVRPEQTDDLSLLQRNVHVVHHGAAAVHLGQAVPFQNAPMWFRINGLADSSLAFLQAFERQEHELLLHLFGIAGQR